MIEVGKMFSSSKLDVSKNRWFSPKIIHVNRVFYYKPSILGVFHLFLVQHPNKVIKMLEEIGTPENVPTFVADVKAKKARFPTQKRIEGFQIGKWLGLEGVHSLKLTASLPLKMDGWKMYVLLKQSLFMCYVSFREGMFYLNITNYLGTLLFFQDLTRARV